jgi:hypothetical protein
MRCTNRRDQRTFTWDAKLASDRGLEYRTFDVQTIDTLLLPDVAKRYLTVCQDKRIKGTDLFTW